MAEYIDRQKVIDIINTTCPDLNIPELNDSWANKLIGVIREALVELVKQAPAADVKENKHGHWTATPTGDYRCSECGYFTVDLVCVKDGEEGWTEIAPNYCSRCGADMRKTCDDQERLNNERLDRE